MQKKKHLLLEFSRVIEENFKFLGIFQESKLVEQIPCNQAGELILRNSSKA